MEQSSATWRTDVLDRSDMLRSSTCGWSNGGGIVDRGAVLCNRT